MANHLLRDFHDRTISELIPEMDRLIEQGAWVFLKWTCPKCGDRAIADIPNTFHRGGYSHYSRQDGQPCGELYTGEKFGYLLMWPPPGTPSFPRKGVLQ